MTSERPVELLACLDREVNVLQPGPKLFDVRPLIGICKQADLDAELIPIVVHLLQGWIFPRRLPVHVHGC
jgi:hypothetical protein